MHTNVLTKGIHHTHWYFKIPITLPVILRNHFLCTAQFLLSELIVDYHRELAPNVKSTTLHHS